MLQVFSGQRGSGQMKKISVVSVFEVVCPEKARNKANRQVHRTSRKGSVQYDCRQNPTRDGGQEVVALNRTSTSNGSDLKTRSSRDSRQRRIILQSFYIGCRKRLPGLSPRRGRM